MPRYVREADHVPEGTTADRPATLGLRKMLGTWYATDPDAGGVVRLDLTETGGRLLVRAYGAGSDEPEDWGAIPATVYAAGVTGTEAMAFSAGYEFPFQTTLLAAYAKQGILVLDTFTAFTDNSSRASYFSREFFHR